MKLYSYFRSSASYRVRIALAVKGLDYDFHGIHLRRNEQNNPDFLAINPQGLVPALVDDDGTVLTQSMAIMEYLDERFPEPSIVPRDRVDRAWVRALSQIVACDIHPVNNLRILKYLETELALDEGTRNSWIRRWIDDGFAATEKMLANDPRTGICCFRDAPTMADICLVPQIFNARRFGVDMERYPTLARINEACMQLAAFADQALGNQPDAD